MIKPNINIFEFDLLYEIFFEIKQKLPFEIKKLNKKDFLVSNENDSLALKDTIIVSNLNNKNFLFEKKNIDKKSIVFLLKKDQNLSNVLDDQIIVYPIHINNLIEKLNVKLIKQKYNNQSFVKISNYTLDLNSRIISNNDNKLKLTEKETDIIIFLNHSKHPQKVNDLQSHVWGFSSELETHTVETHIYRLRKKIYDVFKDENFIVSHQNGYLIQ